MIQIWRPYIVLVSKMDKEYIIIDAAIPADKRPWNKEEDTFIKLPWL